ncbi:MAG: GAF domain-containing protein [Anaerolineae bacterium]
MEDRQYEQLGAEGRRPESAPGTGSAAGIQAVRAWQQQLVRGVLRALVILGPLAAAVSSYYAYTLGQWYTIPIYWSAYAILLVIAFWKRVPYSVKAGTVMALIYGLALLDFYTDGRGGSGRVFLLVLPVMAGLLFGRRESIVVLVVSILTVTVYAWAYSTGVLVVAQEINSADLAGWLSNTIVLLMLGSLVVVSLNFLVPRLGAALGQSQRLARALEDERAQLEVQVLERTQVLERRARYLEATAAVGRETTLELDIGELLPWLASLVSERLGFYHVGIFFLESGDEWLELQAASSEGGRRMLARGHRLAMGEGVVGYAAQHHRYRVVVDVGQDAVFFDNPDLPKTRSEAALPLLARGAVIGVLDVQSTEPNAFSEEDLVALQSLANQMALAVSNARLYGEAQQALQAERAVYGELSRRAWQKLLQAQPELAIVRDEQGILPLDAPPDAEVQQALKSGQAAVGDTGSISLVGSDEVREYSDEVREYSEEARGLAVPIRVRGQVIGAIDAHKPAGSGGWTPEQISLLETLTEQIGDALESARLYADTQRRAAQEQLLGEVTARIRETLDLETVLQTAVDEIREALKLDRAAVRLVVPEGNGDPAQGTLGFVGGRER